MVGKGKAEGPSMRWSAPFIRSRLPVPSAQNLPMTSFSGPPMVVVLRRPGHRFTGAEGRAAVHMVSTGSGWAATLRPPSRGEVAGWVRAGGIFWKRASERRQPRR